MSQSTYLGHMLELANSFSLPLGLWRVCRSVPAMRDTHCRDCTGRRMICHLLSCHGAVLQPLRLLCRLQPPRLCFGVLRLVIPKVHYQLQFQQSSQRKGKGRMGTECQQLRPGNPCIISQDKEKALIQIWNFIPDQFQRAAPGIQ